MFLSDVQKWSSKKLRYERGAWLRVYGTPAHAWNINFFKLCASDCGKFVKADECTLDRGRIDYARVLITTTSLEVLNFTTDVLVDGSMFPIKLVEEWGWNLGEDAFLTEENIEQSSLKDEGFDNFDGHDIEGDGGDVEAILDDLCNDWKEHEAPDPIISYVKHNTNTEAVQELKITEVPIAQKTVHVTAPSSMQATSHAKSYSVSQIVNVGSLLAGSKNNPSCGATNKNKSLKKITNTVTHEELKVAAVHLGNEPLQVPAPHSLQAATKVQGHNLYVGSSKIGSSKKIILSSGATVKNKGGGFRYSSRNLKRVARMTAKDRDEILKILKK